MAARVLGLFAHPDDESLLAGGALAACAACGHEVIILSLTRGESGPAASPGADTPAALALVREEELRSAARVLGASSVQCLDYPDGELTWAQDAPSDLAKRLNDLRPDVIITFGEDGWYWHPDHIATHNLVVGALDALRGRYDAWLYCATWPGGLADALVSAVRKRGLPSALWDLHPSDFGVPRDEITIELDVRPHVSTKLEAIRCHRSQLGPGHLLAAVPADLAMEYLGREYFVRERPAAVREDWLLSMMKGTREVVRE